MFAFSLVGCFLRRDHGEDEPEDVTVALVSVNPAPGSTIPVNGFITVTFDNPPGVVTVSTGIVNVVGKNAVIAGPFTPGQLNLTITWADGRQVITYTIPVPDAEIPKVIEGTISDGDIDVDAAAINTAGSIEITFNEDVKGNIELQTETGVDVGWIGSVEKKTATLELVRGKELSHETTYVIVARVLNDAGNRANIRLTFVTGSAPDRESPALENIILPGRGPAGYDVEEINNAAKIELRFSEEVEGNITLQTETGADVGWIGKVDGRLATLELVRGKELSAGTTYIITWRVSDAAGNENRKQLHFVTIGGPPVLLDKMVLIPAGEFKMGSDDAKAEPHEKPVHTVRIDAFYIDAYEVTNAEYKEFVLAKPEWRKDRIQGRFHDGDYLFHWRGNDYPVGQEDHPVIHVSWYAAMAYAKWVDKRLPTEAEWEKAARGGLSGQLYPWRNIGENIGKEFGAHMANYNNRIGGTTLVGSYSANGYGLYDMAGNVAEWCLDEWDRGFYAISSRNNPISGGPLVDIVNNFPNVRDARTIRGGSWFAPADDIRVAFRAWAVPLKTSAYVGFRCATNANR